MNINGPHITKPVVVPEHTIHVLDEEAYWHLDWEGEEDPEGTFLYARVGWPRLTDAQRQHRMGAQLRAAERANRPKRAYRRRAVRA